MTVCTSGRRFQALFFDLDDTLYRVAQIPNDVKANIKDYMSKHLNIAEEDVDRMCTKLYVEHGTTVAGLVAEGYAIDFDHWHSLVHGSLDYKRLLTPDPKIRELLCRSQLPCYVFTNADKEHAKICLDLLGISDCFQDVIHFESIQEIAKASTEDVTQVVCKPQHISFTMAMQQAGFTDPRTIMFMDDSTRNIKASHDMGMFTVLVGQEGSVDGADLTVPSLHSLEQLLPELFADESMDVHPDEVPAGIPVLQPA